MRLAFSTAFTVSTTPALPQLPMANSTAIVAFGNVLSLERNQREQRTNPVDVAGTWRSRANSPLARIHRSESHSSCEEVMVKITGSIWWGDDPADMETAIGLFSQSNMTAIEELSRQGYALCTFVLLLLHS